MCQQNNKGISLIGALIAISVFSIGFMALTSVIWSSGGNMRTTWVCDKAVLAGQDVVETLSSIDIRDVDDTAAPLSRGWQKIEWDVFNPSDVDNDGRDDFKTIRVRVYHSRDNDLSPDELRMQCCYRRKTD